MKRFGLATAGLLMVVALPARSVASAAGAGGPLRDGTWAGTMSVGATLDVGGSGAAAIVDAKGNGTFNMTLGGGTATGDYALGASANASLASQGGATGETEAVGVIDGTVEGTASGPILQPGQAHFDVTGSVSVNGYQVPINQGFDFGPTDLISSTLVITSSSCTVASGTWAQEFKAAVQGAGVNVTKFSGSWAATYKGGATGAADAALTDILNRGEALLSTWIASGQFDKDGLENVLVDAEHYAAAGPRNDACNAANKDVWASPLSGLVERLLTALANSDSTTAEALNFGIGAGLRTGNLPSVGDPLEGQLQAKASALLDQAIAGGARSDIELIAVSADNLGWSDISARAANALGAGQ